MIELNKILDNADGSEFEINGNLLVVKLAADVKQVFINEREVPESQVKYLLSLDQNAIQQDCLYDSETTGFERLQEFIDFCIVGNDGFIFDNDEYQTMINGQKVYRKQYYRENGSYWIYKLNGESSNVDKLNSHFNVLVNDEKTQLISNESSRSESQQERHFRFFTIVAGIVLLAVLVWIFIK